MHPTPWLQANVAFPDWERAEIAALTHLAPALRAAEDDGALSAWFIVRKKPCWRVRYQPATDGPDRIAQTLDELATAGHVNGWTRSVYEPEVHAFGGTQALGSAHRLFHQDSHALLDFLTSQPRTHRREISLLLCTVMLRSAGLDWYEQGDVWARVSAHRAQPTDLTEVQQTRLQAAVRRLLTVDPHYAVRPHGPLAHVAGWASAYATAGTDLADLAAAGQLHRGLRDILAHHVIFAWNRIGMPYATQVAVSTAAKTIVFGPDPSTESDGSTASHVEPA